MIPVLEKKLRKGPEIYRLVILTWDHWPGKLMIKCRTKRHWENTIQLEKKYYDFCREENLT